MTRPETRACNKMLAAWKGSGSREGGSLESVESWPAQEVSGGPDRQGMSEGSQGLRRVLACPRWGTCISQTPHT